MKLDNRNILLGVSGGIACYKSPEIVRGIRESGGQVSVVMTHSATEFVKPLVFQALSERPVATSLFSLEEENQIGHIKIAERADAMLVAPATANIISKMAHGIADDYLSTSFLACTAPIFVAPAMNHHMWDNPAVQHNLDILKSRNLNIIQPGSGYLACGSYGTGRMAEPAHIVSVLEDFFSKTEDQTGPGSPLKNIRVLITAGPTRERIDAVRYLSNDSSGKMGYALAECCQQLGADVNLISGPTSLPEPPHIETIHVMSARQMMEAVMERSEQAQIIIKAAAVSDFRIEAPNPQKTKKSDTLTLELVKNPDILKELGLKKGKDQFLVGFAAESQDVKHYASQKLKEKNLDLIVANNILQKDAGFNVDTNRVLLIDSKGSRELPLLSKEKVAQKIMDYILAQDKCQSIIRG
jgi:phosphopantothenoylcysteine decarboxylase / phosphopantothenate---cysteine ligase